VKTLLDKVPEDVAFLVRRLRERGKRGWIVGGCVRDLLRGKPSRRTGTCATDARPQEVKRFFSRVIPTGIAHGTVTVLVQHRHVRGDHAARRGRLF
jgi:tRNA nucleotidyltransferase (CCA-adding enzyme)